jgi:hypothetical protein
VAHDVMAAGHSGQFEALTLQRPDNSDARNRRYRRHQATNVTDSSRGAGLGHVTTIT